MPFSPPTSAGLARLPFSALPGFVAGCALQLQQETLWNGLFYGSIVPLATVLYAWIAIKRVANGWLGLLAVLLLAGCLGF